MYYCHCLHFRSCLLLQKPAPRVFGKKEQEFVFIFPVSIVLEVTPALLKGISPSEGR